MLGRVQGSGLIDKFFHGYGQGRFRALQTSTAPRKKKGGGLQGLRFSV